MNWPNVNGYLVFGPTSWLSFAKVPAHEGVVDPPWHSPSYTCMHGNHGWWSWSPAETSTKPTNPEDTLATWMIFKQQKMMASRCSRLRGFDSFTSKKYPTSRWMNHFYEMGSNKNLSKVSGGILSIQKIIEVSLVQNGVNFRLCPFRLMMSLPVQTSIQKSHPTKMLRRHESIEPPHLILHSIFFKTFQST